MSNRATPLSPKEFNWKNEQHRSQLRHDLTEAASRANTGFHELGTRVRTDCTLFGLFLSKKQHYIDFEFAAERMVAQAIANAIGYAISQISFGKYISDVGKAILGDARSCMKVAICTQIRTIPGKDIAKVGLGMELMGVRLQAGAAKLAGELSGDPPPLKQFRRVLNSLQNKARTGGSANLTPQEDYMGGIFYEALDKEYNERLEKYYGVPMFGKTQKSISFNYVYKPFVEAVAKYYGQQTSSMQSKAIARKIRSPMLPRESQFRREAMDFYHSNAE